MSTQVTFIGSGFSLETVSSTVPSRVRVEYTADPRLLNPLGANDGLNPANYSLTGPSLVSVNSVSTVSGHTDMVDLELGAALAPGVWTLTVTNVQTPASVALSSPTSLSFTITARTNSTDLTAGAENDTPARIIRKHLGPALRGPNWDALIEALSRGDDTNWENATLTGNQIWISTASGKYLRQRITDDGIQVPESAGLADANLRELAIRIRTGKLTHESLKEILEIFYGRDALRAYVETETVEPFALQDGQTLTWTLDERHEFHHTFAQDEFTIISQATAVEVAASLTRALSDAGSPGIAVAVTDPETGGVRVRIYSASLGLRSFARVTGGTAQPFLSFNTLVDVYTGDATGYVWAVTEPEQGQVQLQRTATGAGVMDLTLVEPDDYVVVGPAVGVFVAGSYSVLSVDTSWSGGNRTQTLILDVSLSDLTTEAFAGSVTLDSNADFTFFRPERTGINDGDRTVIVVQPRQGQIKVQIPATTAAVSRGVGSAAYLQQNAEITPSRYVRTSDGLLNLYMNLGSYPFLRGNAVILDAFRSRAAVPYVSPGTPGTYPAMGVTATSHGTCWSVVQDAPSVLGDQLSSTTMLNGNLFLCGGYNGPVGKTANRLMIPELPGNLIPVTDGSQADSATKHNYQWLATPDMNEARLLHCVSTLLDGRVFVTGGYTSTTVPKITTEIFDPSPETWAAGANMKVARAGHQQVVLDDGRVLITGGMTLPAHHDATETTEIFNPGLLQFSNGPDMAVARYLHRAVKLNDGRVLITGGIRGGTRMDIDSNTVAYWGFDETNGATVLNDLTGNGHNLALSAGGNFSTDARVGRAYLMNGTSFGTAPDAGGAYTAFQGEWTVEFWLPESISSVPGSNKAIIAFGESGATADENKQMEIGINSAGRIYWDWEKGTQVAVTGTQTTGPALGDYPEGFFVAVRKREETGGVTYAVDLFINGDLVQTWTGLDNATDGGNSLWYLGIDVRAGGGGGAIGYASGAIDELRVSSVARTDQQIKRSCELGNSYNAWNRYCGAATNTTDIFDPTTNTILPGPAMSHARAGHQMVLLDDGRVVVFGGYGRDLTKALPQNDQGVFDYYPNSGLRSAEIWDPLTNRWHPLPDSQEAWTDACVVQKSDRLLITNGYYRADIDYATGAIRNTDQSRIETLLLDSMQWGHHFLQNSPVRDRAITHSSGLALFTGGGVSPASLMIPVADTLGGGGLNGLKLVTSGVLGDLSVRGDSKGLDGDLAAAIAYSNDGILRHGPYGFIDSYSDAQNRGGQVWAGSDYDNSLWTNTITNVARTSNVVTLTCVSDGLSVGQTVFVNINGVADPASGIKTLTAVTSTTVSYADTGSNVASTPVTGVINVSFGDDARVMVGAETADDGADLQGPYVFDADASFHIASAYSTLVTPILKGSQISQIEVVNADNFPDGVGYLVLDFGKETQSKAIKYLENVGDNILLLDSSWVPEYDYAAGVTVTLLGGRGAWVPTPDAGANFYATGTTAARIAAQRIVAEAAAAGMDLDFDVIYPGDIGLGGEGYPTEGEGKLSDVVRVWGGDD